MTDHLRVHTGARLYKCEECGKAFTQSSHLKTHKENVHNTIPMTCDHCQMVLKNKQSLINHMKTHLAERKLHFCSVCKKGLVSKNSRIEHERIHTGEKPYHCDNCSKTFRTMEFLKSHKLTHTVGKKPFKCDICKKGFRERQNYRVHVKTQHSNKRLFSCPICHQRFKLETNGRKHMTAKHNSTLKNLSGREFGATLEPEDMKELSIIIKRRDYIEKAIRKECKSMILYTGQSGLRPLLLL